MKGGDESLRRPLGEVQMDMDQPLNCAAPDLRARPRAKVNWPATCKVHGCDALPVTIVDASGGGFGLRGEMPIAVGTVFSITMADIGTFPCRLIWKEGLRFGIELLEERAYPSGINCPLPTALDQLTDHVALAEENERLRELLDEAMTENAALKQSLVEGIGR